MGGVRPNASENGQISPSTTVRAVRGDGSCPKLASILPEGRKTANICPNSGVIRGIPAYMFKTKTAVTRALGIGTRSVHLGPRKTHRIAMTHSENDAAMDGRTNRSLKRREIIPRMRPLEADRTKLIAAVDIGTSKTTCLMAQLKPRPVGEALPRRTHAIKIMGVGHVNSCGMKAGAVFNFKQIEQLSLIHI